MVHQKLKTLREEKGYSQQEVADAIHIAQNTISNIETGKSKVDVESCSINLPSFLKWSPMNC